MDGRPVPPQLTPHPPPGFRLSFSSAAAAAMAFSTPTSATAAEA